MRKRILTMFWYDDAGEVHLYKDVGGIPYALAKYCGWQATFAYNDVNGIIHNDDYEKYVKLDTIHYPKILCKLKLRYYKYFQVIKYVWKNAPKYDVINFYHCHKFIRFLCWLAKKVNPAIITYVKLDMGREGFLKEKKEGKRHSSWKSTDVFTVEAQKYVDELNELLKFNKKVKYLPNGFFSDLSNTAENIKKEKIILTVGRLGTYQKNTEMLVNAFMAIDKAKISEWKLFLVGPLTNEFKIWLDKKIEKDQFYKDKIIVTGNIADKGKLYEIYSMTSVFVLPSRFESWGLVIIEAMYFKNYVILTNCCDAYHDFINNKNYKYGDIIQNENLEELKKAILLTLENYDNIIDIAKEGSVFIDKKFNWKVVAKILEKYFIDINNEVL